MINSATGVSVPLSTFGGLSTELSPSDLPEGGCPDNSDCAYLPGSVLTRPGLSRLYATPPSTARTVYSDTFTAKDGTQYNILMDANGAIWVENRTTPNAFTKIGTVPAGSHCKSVSAYGRMFMAFNDGTRGTDIPRSFDGTRFNRISQGGPCGNPSFDETIGGSVALASLPGGASTAITSITASTIYFVQSGFFDSVGDRWVTIQVQYYRYLTLVVASAAGFSAGSLATIAGATAGNGTYAVVSASGTSVVLSYNRQTNVSGTGGTLTQAAASLSRSADVVTAGTAVVHGLQPGDMFTVSGVANTVLGGTISSATRASNVITIVTSADNGVRVGSSIIIAGVTDTTFNGTWVVTGVISSTSFQVDSSNLPDATSSGGTVAGQWNNTQRFVVSTPTTTSLTYSDVGPDASTTGAGTITPVGQIAGGQRNAVCLFLTNYGFVTPPSTPIQIATSGGKKMVLSNIPIGPSNIVARIIAFTGIDGGKYFYIPVPARTNGDVISTSTVISDNTSTSAIFDFGDATLLSALAIDIDGNDLFNLKILGNCSGVGWYADRMFYWGDENVAINFQNMGFEGGVDANGNPLAWTVTGTGLTVVPNADFGDGVQFAPGSTAVLSQTAYLDYYGDTILEPNTQYTFKCWASMVGSGASVVADLYDTNTATVLATVTIPLSNVVGFVSGKFSALTPATITSTTVLRVYLSGNALATVTLDEFRPIFTANPYSDTQFAASYVLNPESVDATTGLIGASADPSRIMDSSRMRDNMYFATQQRLHTVKDIAGSEPSGWGVNEIADKCGAASMFSMVSGESWIGWASRDGFRLFDGSQPIKITQDFQQRWDAINQNALPLIWAINDSEHRRMYWGVPLVSSTFTDAVYMLDYRYAETASAIEDRGAIRISGFSGKMLVIEMSRKFSPWTIAATAAGFLATSNGLQATFSDALGRTYTLDPAKLHDDDYGTIPAYVVTSPFVSGEMEQALQLGSMRHLYTFMTVFISGTGKIVITPLADSLTNPWPARGPYLLSASPTRSMEIGLNVAAERCFFKFSAQPIAPSLDAAFNLSRMVVVMEPHPMSPVWGKQ